MSRAGRDRPTPSGLVHNALFEAIKNGHFEVALMLLKHGYGPTLRTYRRGMVAVSCAVAVELDGEPTFPEANLALLPSLIARIAQTHPDDAASGFLELQRVGETSPRACIRMSLPSCAGRVSFVLSRAPR